MAVLWPANVPDQAAFCENVWKQGAAHARNDLPWRFIDDPYAVLVSEVMLQQTQVKRVIGYWPAFLDRFPDVSALAAAPTSDVVAAWQGLGYNRRALALKRAAEECVGQGLSSLPTTYDALIALPGVGPATAAGVQAFARNLPGVYLETNVRTVFLHDVFPDEERVSDKVLAPLVASTCPNDCPREWYYALLDYGAHLKTRVVNPSRRSASYTRQSKFEGSHRQKRSFVLKTVLDQPGISEANAFAALNDAESAAGRASLAPDAFEKIVAELADEGFFTRDGGVLVP